ncbi:YhgE/Pip domain-containing protein [Methanosphaera sp. WGK6]|uniref:YhgE/Pip domain-containing protein n=1 Tax=Methanosphaera sp. WGK6 TaxID=1561964 RepID=UPI0009FBAC4C|nr:YhgE/Pip family protein [Methanosphaera sp. WGK6]
MIENVKKIIKNDFKSTIKNPIVIIVLVALLILPSLYSIINIYACWDPYEDTDNLDYIIVNNDNPVTVNGTTYNYGDKVVSTLQNNSNFNWVYKDEDEARDLLKNGTYYAAIIIPDDFSEDILSVYSGNPKQAQIEYIDNEKVSPVAPKITSKAAERVNNEINNAINEEYNTRNYLTSNAVTLQQTQIQNNSTTNNTNTAEVSESMTVQNIRNYFHSPTTLNNYSYYEADNYAQQVTPFYTVLAAWVGCIILVALLSTKPVTDEEKYSPSEVYFGKMVLFIILNICQSIVTFIGLNLLGVHIVNPLAMILSMIVIGLSFMIVIYSLVSVLGNVGKALALIILVFQISGTNGIYPIEIMSSLFGGLMPYLPMTYGILLLKDAVFGIVMPNFTINLGLLIIFPLAAIAFSIIIKEKLDKKAKYFERELGKSNLFELRK